MKSVKAIISCIGVDVRSNYACSNFSSAKRKSRDRSKICRKLYIGQRMEIVRASLVKLNFTWLILAAGSVRAY
jgi:hypothetical protein